MSGLNIIYSFYHYKYSKNDNDFKSYYNTYI